MTTDFHIFRYPEDPRNWAVSYYEIHIAGCSSVKGNVYSSGNTCENQVFVEHYLPFCPQRWKELQATEREQGDKAKPLRWD